MTERGGDVGEGDVVERAEKCRAGGQPGGGVGLIMGSPAASSKVGRKEMSVAMGKKVTLVL